MADPRSRRVIAAQQRHNGHEIELECGHRLKRRFAGGVPTHVICTKCPAKGGIGGSDFQGRRNS